MRRSNRRRQVVFTILIIGGLILLVGGFGLWAVYQFKPGWFPDWFDTLFTVVAGLGALITVLGALISRIILPLLERWEQSKAASASQETDSFPFEVIASREQLMERLLPDPEQRVLPDRRIEYIRGRANELDSLFRGQGRILLTGKSKVGKSREMGELIGRHWEAGLNVLFLRPNAWLEAPYALPEQLPHRNVVLVVDDIDRYCAFDRPLDRVGQTDLSTSHQSFPQRLQQAIVFFETMCGSSGEVRVVATVRSETEHWSKIDYDARKPPWKGFEIFRLDDLPFQTALHLINQLSRDTKIGFVDNEHKIQMARKNDGTFLNIILHFRDWFNAGDAMVGSTQIDSFEGNLATTWDNRYRRAVAANPTNQYIYAAVDLLRQFGLSPHELLVTELATRLEGRPSVRLSRAIQSRLRRTASGMLKVISGSRIVRGLVSRVPGIRRPYNRVMRSRFGRTLGLYWAILTGGVLGDGRVRPALQQMVKTEIPIQNRILMPYDGQVDERGVEWLDSRVVSDLLVEQASDDERFASYLGFVAMQFYRENRPEAALDCLERAFALDAETSISFFHSRGSTLLFDMKAYDQAIHEADAALARLDRYDAVCHMAYEQKGIALRELGRYYEAIEALSEAEAKGPRCPTCLGHRATAYRLLRRYGEALSDLDRAIDLWSDWSSALTNRGEIHMLLGDSQKALDDLSRAIELAPRDDLALSARGLLRRLMGDKVLAQDDLTQAIELAQEHGEAPEDWSSTFDLALHNLRAGNYEDAEQLYREALTLGAPHYTVRRAFVNLDELLHLVPDLPRAQAIRELLQGYCDPRPGQVAPQGVPDEADGAGEV